MTPAQLARQVPQARRVRRVQRGQKVIRAIPELLDQKAIKATRARQVPSAPLALLALLAPLVQSDHKAPKAYRDCQVLKTRGDCPVQLIHYPEPATEKIILEQPTPHP